ncbi:uncharacterized protein A1O5_12527 [Cladophialophora psammophila CBS 110553]|uniref:FAD/NAD(P)-binding domain-containing protein n=1 Tax=Cladophialophora psammophila CBS 110553 TaxID=1182543 RepID=W9VPT1_9EURO|nr:uncharacterized protein A1O5_12527 [Cladophialophora psammophila CBS 110553]EXJ57737.1 hypothetical protein A1O5_12527 [Cladophialophora psammophila CBS 110553]
MASSPLEYLPCALPSRPLPADLDSEAVCNSFQDVLYHPDASILTTDSLWRDLFALTGSIRTFYGADKIVKIWKTLTANARPKRFKYVQKSSRTVRFGESQWIEGTFSFAIDDAPARDCTAIISLVPTADGKWQIWIFRTLIDKLQNHPSVDKLAPVSARTTDAKSILSMRTAQDEFDCAIVGAGQAGLSVAGRLQSQGVKYVLLERNAEVGDSWKTRYKSTKLHTTRESSHLPFDRTFPPHYPQYLTKDDLAQGYLDWAKKYGINVWLSTTVVSGRWHEDEKRWTLNLVRNEERKSITVTHLVMALGAGCQIPTMPTYPGIERFRGTVVHSANYTSAEGWEGKHGIVVGTANTAHDVAEDMVAANMASVTMVQRSPTYVLPAEYYTKVQNLSYNPEIPTEVADQMNMTNPLALSRHLSMLMLNEMAKAEPDRFDALEAAGFKVIRYGDLIYQVFDRFGGHYMDVGASAKIAKGLIKIKSDALPLQYTEDGLKFTDGADIRADFIVFATGFVGSMKVAIHDILGSDVAERIEDFWGINEEGEIKGAFKPSGYPNLWMHGGTCVHARYMSKFIALQIRAALDGTPLPVATE